MSSQHCLLAPLGPMCHHSAPTCRMASAALTPRSMADSEGMRYGSIAWMLRPVGSTPAGAGKGGVEFASYVLQLWEVWCKRPA